MYLIVEIFIKKQVQNPLKNLELIFLLRKEFLEENMNILVHFFPDPVGRGLLDQVHDVGDQIGLARVAEEEQIRLKHVFG